MSSRASRILWPVIWTAGAIAALVVLLVLNQTAREVVKDTAVTLFAIFTTPFIFETTVAIIGVFLVLAINHWRIKKEGDGWVYLVTQEPDPSAGVLSPQTTQRLQGIVMHEKPEAADEAGTSRAHIEGFLELGMAGQAAEALRECDSLPDDEATVALRIRVLAANLDTVAAQELLRAGTARFSNRPRLFAQTALDCAAWLECHVPQQRDAVKVWQAELKHITG
jgi:hypothetical protein